MPPLVPDVAIVSHNTDYYLLNLLTSLEPLRAASCIGDVCVWDNASTDATADVLARLMPSRPWLHACQSPTNVHHGPALDALLRNFAQSEWVLALDADTTVRRRFDGALAGVDVSEAAFVGQIHPGMPHLYAYLAHLLVHRGRYFDLPPFRHHGAPGVDYFRAIEEQRQPFVRFRWCDYVHHFGQGALQRVVERGERDNEFYGFARRELERQPKSAERVAQEDALRARLRVFLDSDMPKPARRDPPSCAPCRADLDIGESSRVLTPPARPSRSRGIGGAALWIRSPRTARWWRDACRMGCVQKSREALDLLRILEPRRPQRVVEIGTAHGGSFMLWARASAPDATLVSVDLPPWELDDPAEAAKRRALERVASDRQSVHVVRGSSHDRDVRRRVEECLDGEPVDFLFIDGDRSYEGVKRDFLDYAGLVRRGGLVALHGIHPHSQRSGGDVPAFWNEIRRGLRHAELIADRAQDGFGIGVIWT